MNPKTALLCLVMAAGHRAEPAPSGTLRWRNGEAIPGEILAASPSQLTWKTDLFEEPVLLRWDVLRRIDQVAPAVASSDPFGIVLRDGSYLCGSLTGITGKSITVRSKRCGEVVLKRSEVLSIRRISGKKTIFGGPSGDVQWSAARKQGDPAGASAIPGFGIGSGGALVFPFWNRGAFLKLDLPEQVEIAFRVSSSQRPRFSLSLGSDAQPSLRIETWSDEVVLAAAENCRAIQALAEEDRVVELRLCWDRPARKCAVFTPNGDLITEWEVPELTTKADGLTLYNKGNDMALDSLQIRSWDGKPPAKYDRQKPSLQLVDGRRFVGEIGEAPPGSIDVENSGSKQSFSFEDLDTVVFGPDALETRERPASLIFADGTLVKGKIASIGNGTAAIETSFAEKPLHVSMDSLRQLLVDMAPPADVAPGVPLEKLDRLSLNKITLHGKFVCMGDDKPRIQLVGGAGPSTPAALFASEIERAFPAETEFRASPALFYLTNGDVLPGRLMSLDRAGVELESSIAEVAKLSAEQLNAIQFDAACQTGIRGFDGPGWRIIKGDANSVVRDANTIQMQPETAIGHPFAAQAGEIDLRIKNGSWVTVRLRLFCAGLDPSRSMSIVVGVIGRSIYCGRETGDGEMRAQSRGYVVPGDSISIRLVFDPKRVHLLINDVPTDKYDIDPTQAPGSGLVIEPAVLFGNASNPIVLADFSALAAPGRISLPSIDEETRKQALTVPRFRKEDLPRHLLLAGNGDVLRGEIEAVTANHLGFRSGLENLRIPRERVQAAIWLKKPENAPAETPPESRPNVLDRRLTSNTTYMDAALSSLIEFIKRDASDLEFKFPQDGDGPTVTMEFRGQTLGEALDEICGVFGLRHRLEKGRTIVLERDSREGADFIERNYRLKPDVFPAGVAAQEYLTGKGISFPKGAAAAWSKETNVLTMKNDPAGHRLLLESLKTELDAEPDGLTYWLLLVNGARLALTVERFDQEFVVGRHPMYGRCSIPLEDVYAIHSSPPEPSVVMKSVGDWRMVHAPEPVLPETGGENSPMLGKDAPAFRLPVLGGGEFELQREKGKIIVLDFWASWCGPCIRSLPGLMEAMSAFPADRVVLVGVNQGEQPKQVKRFLETRRWDLKVALDSNGSAGRLYRADGIPHTVIVGPDGKVAWVKSGDSGSGGSEAAEVVKRLLGNASPP